MIQLIKATSAISHQEMFDFPVNNNNSILQGNQMQDQRQETNARSFQSQETYS